MNLRNLRRADSEQDSAEDYFEVITSADQGVILVFEADLLNLEKNSKTDLSEEELQQLQEQEHTFQAGEIVRISHLSLLTGMNAEK